jgi:hypothetical protein
LKDGKVEENHNGTSSNNGNHHPNAPWMNSNEEANQHNNSIIGTEKNSRSNSHNSTAPPTPHNMAKPVDTTTMVSLC